ncbi:MAG TPA: queuosine precursor transporter [Halobacteriales archaeon]|uniref:queuosine precursor transporter n=1 Tax=Candidatus Hikarchaeum yamanae TaxID=2675326 RepID=UPI00184A47D1|nr:queuosine precursor transporter [Halobacteriales archaeon]|tara:strand:+ start:52767 stop:53480 length:714 start_codon:yes stop_codon:yes gene_type:complete
MTTQNSTTLSSKILNEETIRIGLIALFITGLLTAQLTAVKILELSPLNLGISVMVPAGVLAYAITFFASDCYAELYGKKAARTVVSIAFTMNIVMLVLIWISINAPGSEAGISPELFATVLGPSANVVIASLTAYLISQNLDILIFDTIREKTNGNKLWLRNIGSTTVSQLVDTILFITLTFSILPSIVGIGIGLPLFVIVQLILGQYIVKLLIALADTPLIYAFFSYLKKENLMHS